MQVITNPCSPFSTAIYNGLPYGAKIEIEGVPFQGPVQNFALELFAGPNIAFHMNARYGMCGEYALVMNSMEGGVWRHEERHSSPFHVGQSFHLKMTIKDDKIKIKVCGEKYHFHHRIPPHCINSIGIKGDVTIHCVRFERVNIGSGQGCPPHYGGVPPVYGGPPMPQHPPAYGGAPPPFQPPYGGAAPPPPVVVVEGHHHHHDPHHHHHHDGGYFGFEHKHHGC